jgi:hypothetical protein
LYNSSWSSQLLYLQIRDCLFSYFLYNVIALEKVLLYLAGGLVHYLFRQFFLFVPKNFLRNGDSSIDKILETNECSFYRGFGKLNLVMAVLSSSHTISGKYTTCSRYLRISSCIQAENIFFEDKMTDFKYC